MIQDFGRHKSPKFTHDAWVVYRVLRTSFFDDLEEINAAYEIQANFVSLYITVFQLANLGLLEFFFFLISISMNNILGCFTWILIFYA